MILHDYLDSGNGYKCRLLLALTNTPYRLELHDILRGATRTPEFIAKNPDGRIPLLELNDGRCLAQSNAILYHLSQDTPYWPDDAWARAQVMQWLFFEQYSHEPQIAVARFIMRHESQDSSRRQELGACHAKGKTALDIMNNHLTVNKWMAGESMTIADIALYAYTHVADQGGFDLAGYDGLTHWFKQIQSLPHYVGIEDVPDQTNV